MRVKANTTPQPPLALRVSDFCQRLSICPSTFWKYHAANKIRTIKIGSCVLVPADEVERILREGIGRS